MIGVAITLFASNLISDRSVKRDVSLSLNAIKIELKTNANAFENYANGLRKSVGYSNYVLSHDDKSVSKDSIDYYAYSNQDGIGWGEINSQTLLVKKCIRDA